MKCPWKESKCQATCILVVLQGLLKRCVVEACGDKQGWDRGLWAPADLFRQVGAGCALKMRMINCPADGIVWCEWVVWILCVGADSSEYTKDKRHSRMIVYYSHALYTRFCLAQITMAVGQAEGWKSFLLGLYGLESVRLKGQDFWLASSSPWVCCVCGCPACSLTRVLKSADSGQIAGRLTVCVWVMGQTWKAPRVEAGSCWSWPPASCLLGNISQKRASLPNADHHPSHPMCSPAEMVQLH